MARACREGSFWKWSLMGEVVAACNGANWTCGHGLDDPAAAAVMGLCAPAVLTLRNPRQQSGQEYVGCIYDSIEALKRKGNMVAVLWIPASAENRLLQSAKAQARDATEEGANPPLKFPRMRSTTLRVARSVHCIVRDIPDDVGRFSKKVDAALPGKHTLQLYDGLSWREANVLAQLRTGMSRLNGYLNKIAAAPSQQCACGYAKETVGFLSLLTDSSPVGKQNLLSCYQRAREQALTASNIKGGWKATDLWPVSVAKPLLSPLLLENSNKRKKDAKKAPDAFRSPFSTPGWQSDASQIAWSTPRRPQDLKVQVLQFNQLDDDVPTKRLLFRKITKGFDEKDGLLAEAQLQIQALETQLAAAKPKKRKRVETSPNSRFADVEAVRRAQAEVNAAENGDPDRTEDELSEIGDDWIVVSVGRQ
ncbi:UbiE/COQ5 family methyltransferase [Purpureocillium lavendulum]|uniref:UbiE/COQ5 family methyltransferase n=1 Tax=Purpureocillium lavendulum TaxID=1247861 RepID=A0AB34FCN3_9HYPO|nr:UbiE/COQ5 family methyltransferase [Purpureocillium lavendulum]